MPRQEVEKACPDSGPTCPRTGGLRALWASTGNTQDADTSGTVAMRCTPKPSTNAKPGRSENQTLKAFVLSQALKWSKHHS